MNPKILLVEDDPFLREGLTELLLHEQYAVTAVAAAALLVQGICYRKRLRHLEERDL